MLPLLPRSVTEHARTGITTREFNETRNLTLTRNEKPSYVKYEIYTKINSYNKHTLFWLFTCNRFIILCARAYIRSLMRLIVDD